MIEVNDSDENWIGDASVVDAVIVKMQGINKNVLFWIIILIMMLCRIRVRLAVHFYTFLKHARLIHPS